MVDDRFQLAVVFPKEHRYKQRIIKYIAISSHVDKALCPVSAYQTYLARLPQPLSPVPHQKDPSHSSVIPLIRYLKDTSKATGSVRIDVFHNEKYLFSCFQKGLYFQASSPVFEPWAHHKRRLQACQLPISWYKEIGPPPRFSSGTQHIK
ncbi:hypothetical protein BGZ76_003666 [Entomortierella beljakovae]|nr:hypothetical protein BGZ76_003666 [Entomortierella beljakovae]